MMGWFKYYAWLVAFSEILDHASYMISKYGYDLDVTKPENTLLIFVCFAAIHFDMLVKRL